MRSIRFVVLTALAVVLVALTSSAATARPDGAAATRVTVTFWHAYAENPAAPEMQQLTKSVIPRFERLNPGIKVQQVPFSYGNLQQKLTTSAAGGTLPDLIRSDLAWVPQYAKLGVFAPLNKVMPDFKRFANAMFPGTLATNFYKGNYYGLPLDTNTRVLMYNRQALTAAGISSPPQTFAELRAAAPKLKAKGVYLFADGGTGGWNMLPWIWSGGGSLTNPSYTKATGFLNSARTVAAVQLLVDLYKQGAIPSLITGDQGATGTENGLAEGKYATILDGPWMLPIFSKAHPGFTALDGWSPGRPGRKRQRRRRRGHRPDADVEEQGGGVEVPAVHDLPMGTDPDGARGAVARPQGRDQEPAEDQPSLRDLPEAAGDGEAADAASELAQDRRGARRGRPERDQGRQDDQSRSRRRGSPDRLPAAELASQRAARPVSVHETRVEQPQHHSRA